MIRTIETDPDSPFGPLEVPAAEWTFRHCRAEAFKRGDQFVQAWITRAGVRDAQFPKFMSLDHTVKAYVNHGRWLWDCPRCAAAQCCTPYDPRAFCADCLNGGDGWYPVLWPAEQHAIETLLERRSLDDQRNWALGETVAQLQSENLSLGLDPETLDHEWPGAQQALALVSEHLQLAGTRTRELGS